MLDKSLSLNENQNMDSIFRNKLFNDDLKFALVILGLRWFFIAIIHIYCYSYLWPTEELLKCYVPLRPKTYPPNIPNVLFHNIDKYSNSKECLTFCPLTHVARQNEMRNHYIIIVVTYSYVYTCNPFSNKPHSNISPTSIGLAYSNLIL